MREVSHRILHCQAGQEMNAATTRDEWPPSADAGVTVVIPTRTRRHRRRDVDAVRPHATGFGG